MAMIQTRQQERLSAGALYLSRVKYMQATSRHDAGA